MSQDNDGIINGIYMWYKLMLEHIGVNFGLK